MILRSLLLASLVFAVACDDAHTTETVPAPAPTPAPDAAPPPPAPDAAPPVEEPADDGILACTWDELSPLLTCALAECAGLDLDPAALLGGGGLSLDFDTDEIMSCALTECSAELITISPTCVQCLFAAISGDYEACLDIDLGGLGGGGLPGGGGGGGGFPGIP
jgi:hypothetical protein